MLCTQSECTTTQVICVCAWFCALCLFGACLFGCGSTECWFVSGVPAGYDGVVSLWLWVVVLTWIIGNMLFRQQQTNRTTLSLDVGWRFYQLPPATCDLDAFTISIHHTPLCKLPQTTNQQYKPTTNKTNPWVQVIPTLVVGWVVVTRCPSPPQQRKEYCCNSNYVIFVMIL